MTRAGKAGPDNAWPEALSTPVRKLPAHCGLFVALSGGLDSVLLLHTAARVLGRTGSLTAIHINHQLQPNASKTEDFCRRLCQSLGLPCQIVRVEVKAETSSDTTGTGGLEEAARKARYRAFESCLGEGDLLLMAHHGDDQAETVLFRLIRGTGVAGLSGMPVSRALGRGALYRPFLGFSRPNLEAWAKEQGIDWVEDPSNRDQRFDRNFLRQSIMPVLRERWPSLNRRLAATASACRESAELGESLASIHFARCGTAEGGLDLSLLAGLTLAEQKNLIRWWVVQRQFPPPNTADWPGLLSDFIESDTDRQPEYCGDGYVLRRFQQVLQLVSNRPVPGNDRMQLLPGQEVVWGDWRLTLLASTAGSDKPPPELKVRRRQGGERIRVRPDGPSKLLKKWLQEKAVPAWERDSLPLVMSEASGDDALVAVGHLWISEQYHGEMPSSGWSLILERDSD